MPTKNIYLQNREICALSALKTVRCSVFLIQGFAASVHLLARSLAYSRLLVQCLLDCSPAVRLLARFVFVACFTIFVRMPLFFDFLTEPELLWSFHLAKRIVVLIMSQIRSNRLKSPRTERKKYNTIQHTQHSKARHGTAQHSTAQTQQYEAMEREIHSHTYTLKI